MTAVTMNEKRKRDSRKSSPRFRRVKKSADSGRKPLATVRRLPAHELAAGRAARKNRPHWMSLISTSRWRTSGSTWNERASRYARHPLVLLGRLQTERDRQVDDRRFGNRKLVSIASAWEMAIKRVSVD